MEFDKELLLAKQKVKDIKKLRKQHTKLRRLQSKGYRIPVQQFVLDIVDSICFTFKDMVEKP